MLYLHCGWPRTSTTTLQVALLDHQEELSSAGTLFPDQWMAADTPEHQGLTEMLDSSLTGRDGFSGLKRFLFAHADKDILLSAEVLTNWLVSTERQDALIGLLGAAQEVVPTRCIWTLRRYDEFVASLYLLILGKHAMPPPARRREERGAESPLAKHFSGLKRLEETVGGDAVYVKYEASGGHNLELLNAFGIDGPVGRQIGEQLTSGRRLNTSLSRKQAIVLINLDALSARAGVDFDDIALREAFKRNDIRFEGDGPTRLGDLEWRRELHEHALGVAQSCGIDTYHDFFADAEIDGPATDLGEVQAITDADLDLLISSTVGQLT